MMKRISQYAIALAFVVTSPIVQATPQVGTPFSINGTNHFVYGFSLHPDMHRSLGQHRDEISRTTANIKGYRAKLELKDQSLFLIELSVRPKTKFMSSNDALIKNIFGISIPEQGIYAEWFSGSIREYFGKSLGYIHVKSYERIYSFKNGKLTGIQERETKLGKSRRPRN